MRTNRTNNQVNNIAANAAQSSTSSCASAKPTKTASELYGMTIAQAYATIMDAKTKGLAVVKMPKMVYIKAADGSNPALTNSVRKECNVIAGMECWNAEARCYRAWDSAKKRYAISRAKWDKAEAAAAKGTKPKAPSPAPAPTKEVDATQMPIGAFSREQVIAIAKRLNSKTTAKMVDAAIAAIVGTAPAEKSLADVVKDNNLMELHRHMIATCMDWANQGGLAAQRLMRDARKDFNATCKKVGFEPSVVAAYCRTKADASARRNRRMSNIG